MNEEDHISYKIHRFNLEFEDKAIEERFLLTTFSFRVRTFRIICSIAAILHFVYLFKDYFWAYNNAVPIRAFVILPFFLFCLLISKASIIKDSISNFHRLAILVVLFAVFMQLYIVWISPNVYIQISHTIPIIIYGTYIFIGVKFKHLLYYLGPITLVIPLLFMWYLMDYTFGQKIDDTIVLTANYFIASFAKYNLGLFHRNNFSKDEIRKVQKKLIVQYNQEIDRQKVLYRGLTERSDDVITIRDLDGALEFVSMSVEELLGYKPAELIGTNVDSLIHPDDLQKMKGVANKNIAEGKHPRLEYRMIHKSGKEVWVQTVGVPIIDNEDKLVSVQGSTRDISYKKKIELELKESNEKLEELNEQKDKLFSIISHDLRGPFNNMVSLTNILKEHIDAYSKEDIAQIVDHLENAAQSSRELLENLLTWSKTQLAGSVINKTFINLHDVITTNIELLNPLAIQKNITMLVDVAKAEMIYADMEMIKTVIRNVLSNAIKFTSSGGAIKLYTRNKSINDIDIVIEDNGVGISEERIDKLFRLASKETTKGTNQEGGTGLGLLICKNFIELNDGEISIESELNKGSKIIFKLPIVNLN